ncbi:hypothetical protein OF83DRAFT_945986 [Amylostereum chailletii]|nr:hypothetical protein OF83DRAFT_945986 [Amylostereum chailletii]
MGIMIEARRQVRIHTLSAVLVASSEAALSLSLSLSLPLFHRFHPTPFCLPHFSSSFSSTTTDRTATVTVTRTGPAFAESPQHRLDCRHIPQNPPNNRRSFGLFRLPRERNRR